jgi:hypothetical protein
MRNVMQAQQKAMMKSDKLKQPKMHVSDSDEEEKKEEPESGQGQVMQCRPDESIVASECE